MVEETKPDIVQVQAEIEDFPVAMTRAVKTRFPEIPIIRAVPVIDEASIEIAASYRGVADFLLLDSWDAGTRQFGALGRVHDWTLSRRIVEKSGSRPFSPAASVPTMSPPRSRRSGPAGVDSKTKTDRPDGSGKDLASVEAFVAAAKLTR